MYHESLSKSAINVSPVVFKSFFAIAVGMPTVTFLRALALLPSGAHLDFILIMLVQILGPAVLIGAYLLKLRSGDSSWKMLLFALWLYLPFGFFYQEALGEYGSWSQEISVLGSLIYYYIPYIIIFGLFWPFLLIGIRRGGTLAIISLLAIALESIIMILLNHLPKLFYTRFLQQELNPGPWLFIQRLTFILAAVSIVLSAVSLGFSEHRRNKLEFLRWQ